MPWNQPLRKIMMKAMTTPLVVKKGTVPISVMHRPDSSRPQGRKALGLARSEMDAIRNLDRP